MTTEVERDEFVATAIAHWTPRMVQNGVDHNDFVATTARIATWPQWLPAWSATADGHVARAREAERAGHLLTAGHAWRQAAVCRHFGKFVWNVEATPAEEATRRCAQEHRRALALLDGTFERVETVFDGGLIAAELRRPPGVGRPPLVVLLPGLDSTKEEFYFLEQSLLDRGLATLAIDGPGQGETGLSIPVRVDYHRAISAVLDRLPQAVDVSRLDLVRLGLYGVSLGGFYAPLVAAHEPRFRAMVAISGPYSFADLWRSLPPLSRSTFMSRARVSSEDDALALAAGLDLTGLCGRIGAVSLYMTGDEDRLIPWTETRRQADETPDATFVLYEGGNHGVSNLPHIARPAAADWMADRLARS